MHSMGIDIGSSAIKSCVLDHRNTIVFSYSSFHYGNVQSELLKHIDKAADATAGDCIFLSVTGKQSGAFEKLQPYFINEVPATVEGSLLTDPGIRSIIEIGAQNSKFITNFSCNDKNNIRFFMNTSCSAGTGSFLEEQASRLNIGLENLSDYASRGKNPVRIAGRCSVFSKTDMIHHQQEGAAVEDILLGLIFAMVRNYKANVVKKTKIELPVLLAGGVMHNKKAVSAVTEVFRIPDNRIIVPENYSYMGAIGCAAIAGRREKTVQIGKLAGMAGAAPLYPVPLSFRKSLKNFGNNDGLEKHICLPHEKPAEGFLGIDAGSTSTNLVLIDESGKVLSYRYLRTEGRPSDAVDRGLKSLKTEFGENVTIRSIGTTGSGRYLIAKKTGADVIENEISAQAEGAICIDPEVDTIFEIGGQDSKYIRLKDGAVVDFTMNKICAAGTGSFIEEQALKLGIGIEEFGKMALSGENPVELGERCTVFIEGSISKALARGENREDILAGLSYSIVKNYLDKVVGNRRIGKKIFLQGGIAHNQGVVNAFRALTGREITVPDFFSVTGAYGIAMLTLKKHKRAENETEQGKKPVNIFRKSEELFLEGYSGELDKKKPVIGIPRVLFMHKLFVLFNVFFRTLGFNVLLSDATDKKIVDLSQRLQMDETCYPVKLINGHVKSLIDKGVDYIFLPRLHTMKHSGSKTRMDYACVYMQASPLLTAHSADIESSGVKLLSPEFSFKAGRAYMAKTLLSIGPEIGRNRFQTAFALKKGVSRILDYNKKMKHAGRCVIENLGENETAFVIITRPYGVTDPELNMKIPDLLVEKGYNVLALSNLDIEGYDLSGEYPNMYWPFGQHILAGAKVIRNTPNLYAIYLTNHGCGPDTVLAHFFEKEMRGKAYLHIEVDEHFSEVGVLTRLEAFINSVATQRPTPPLEKNNEKAVRQTNEKDKSKTGEKLYIPNLYPFSHLLCELFKAGGRNADVLPETDRNSFEKGKQFSISKEYLSLTSLMGDILYHADRISHEKPVFWIPGNEGGETYGQYEKLINDRLREKRPDAKTESPFIEDLLMDAAFGTDFLSVLLAGDIIMAAPPQMRARCLKRFCRLIREKALTIQALTDFAENIYSQAAPDNKKALFITGETGVIFNPFNNNFEIEKLEKNHRLVFQPMSETLYFLWNDYGNRLKNSDVKNRLRLFREHIETVSVSLKRLSPFDDNLDELTDSADDMLRLYSGGNGRYRLAKMLRSNNAVDGIISMESMYENTGVILRILTDRYRDRPGKPVLNLTFDGSTHSSNEELINNYVFYL